jgi:hypothetical protein
MGDFESDGGGVDKKVTCPACLYEPPQTEHRVGSGEVGATYFTSPTQSSIILAKDVAHYLKTGDRGPYCREHIEEATEHMVECAVGLEPRVDFKNKKVILRVHQEVENLPKILEKTFSFKKFSRLVAALEGRDK